MRIALMARVHRLYSHQRLREAAIERGHQVEMIDTLGCYLSIRDHKTQVHCAELGPTKFDAVIPRIGASALTYGLAVVRQFEADGVAVLNHADAIGCAGDKLHSLQVLAGAGVNMPLTTFAHDSRKARAVLQTVGGVPVIIKLLEGSLGMGVILAETEKTAVSVFEAFRGANVNILVQQFIKESAGTDIRALVVGDRVVAAMRRTGAPGEFRSNLHRGGSAEFIQITDEEADIAVRASQAIGLSVSGIDLLRSNRGSLVLEVNSSPGIEGIEKATKIDVAGQIVDLLVDRAEQVKGN